MNDDAMFADADEDPAPTAPPQRQQQQTEEFPALGTPRAVAAVWPKIRGKQRERNRSRGWMEWISGDEVDGVDEGDEVDEVDAMIEMKYESMDMRV